MSKFTGQKWLDERVSLAEMVEDAHRHLIDFANNGFMNYNTRTGIVVRTASCRRRLDTVFRSIIHKGEDNGASILVALDLMEDLAAMRAAANALAEFVVSVFPEGSTRESDNALRAYAHGVLASIEASSQIGNHYPRLIEDAARTVTIQKEMAQPVVDRLLNSRPKTNDWWVGFATRPSFAK